MSCLFLQRSPPRLFSRPCKIHFVLAVSTASDAGGSKSCFTSERPRNIVINAGRNFGRKKKPFRPGRTIARNNQRRLYPAARGTACSASPSWSPDQHRSIRLSDFRCPISGSTAWRRFSQRRCRLVLAAVDDLRVGVGLHDTASAQIDNDLVGRFAGILQQDRCFRKLLLENVYVIWLARVVACADRQPTSVADGNADLTPNS